MEFGAALSRRPDAGTALEEALALASVPLSRAPDIVICFATVHHRESAREVAAGVHDLVSDRGTSLGALADGVIAGTVEAEDGPALAIWAGVLPGVGIVSSHLEAVRTTRGVAVGGWDEPEDAKGAVLVADPYTFPAGPFARTLGERGLPVSGGLANGGGPGRGALMRDGIVYDHGAVALVLGGPLVFRTVVSQGCRPVGTPAVVTASQGSEVLEIGGKPALEFLQDLLDALDPEDRRMVTAGLQIGIVADEHQVEFARGDFLVRAVVDADPDSGAITVGEDVPVGRTVQFQVRDPAGASEDLHELLHGEPAESGVLLFSCNGRGRRFFGTPGHDAAAVDEEMRPTATAGFFAAGELGPVGGTNHLHGLTASIVELLPAYPEP